MSTAQLTTTILRCDNLRKCDKQINWVEQQVKNDPNALPDEFFRFLRVVYWVETLDPQQPNQGGFKEFAFCSDTCLKQHFKDYVAPRSPRQLSAQAANNAAVDARNNVVTAAPVTSADGAERIEDVVTGVKTQNGEVVSEFTAIPSVAVPELSPDSQADGAKFSDGQPVSELKEPVLVDLNTTEPEFAEALAETELEASSQ